MSVFLVFGPSERDKPIPDKDVFGVGIDESVSFMIQCSAGSTLDTETVNVSIQYDALDIPARKVFENGKIQENFTGNMVLTSSPTVPSLNPVRDRVKFVFGHDVKFFYNSQVTITVTGTEYTPVPVPYTVIWSFNTTVFSNTSPNGSTLIPTPSIGGVPSIPDNSPVDKNISFSLNSARGNAIPRSSLSVNVSWPPSFSDQVMLNGVVDPNSEFSLQFSDTMPAMPTVQISRKATFLPYQTSLTVTVTGLDGVIPFTAQTLKFRTINQPLTLEDASSAALDDVQSSYGTIKDDGALATYLKAATDPGVVGVSPGSIRITPSAVEGPSSGELTDDDADFGDPDTTRDIYTSKVISIVGSAPENTRVTTITRRKDQNTLLVDTKGNAFKEDNNIVSYAVSSQVVRGSKTIQGTSPGLSGIEDQTKSMTNAVFLAMQNWIRSVGAFRYVFTPEDVVYPIVTLTGSVTVTNGSSAVTGIGTAFTSQLSTSPPSFVRFGTDTTVYQVNSITSDQALGLSVVYAGTTVSGVQGFRLSRDWSQGPADYETAASLVQDPNNDSLSVCSFATGSLPLSPAMNGVGWKLTIPDGAHGLDFSIRGRASNLTFSPVSYVGWTLYFRPITTSPLTSSWSSIVLPDLSVASEDYFSSPAHRTLLGGSLVPGTMYQFELVRTPTSLGNALLSLNSDFLLLEILIDFT